MKVTFALVNLTVAILEMDRERDGRLWGYELSKRSGVRSGVLYPQLDRMLDDGWLTDAWEQVDGASRKRPPRRYYTLTDAGREELAAVVRKAKADARFRSVRVKWA